MQRVCVTEGDAGDEGKMMLSGRFGGHYPETKKRQNKGKSASFGDQRENMEQMKKQHVVECEKEVRKTKGLNPHLRFLGRGDTAGITRLR